MNDLEKLIAIAEEFNLWLINTSQKYSLDTNKLQEIIKQFLNG